MFISLNLRFASVEVESVVEGLQVAHVKLTQDVSGTISFANHLCFFIIVFAIAN